MTHSTIFQISQTSVGYSRSSPTKHLWLTRLSGYFIRISRWLLLLTSGLLYCFAGFWRVVVQASRGMGSPLHDRETIDLLIIRTDKMVAVLMAYIINTGLLSSVCALCILITVSKALCVIDVAVLLKVFVYSTQCHITLYMWRSLRVTLNVSDTFLGHPAVSVRRLTHPEVYFNALLAMLNARGKLRRSREADFRRNANEAVQLSFLSWHSSGRTEVTETSITSSIDQNNRKGYPTDVNKDKVEPTLLIQCDNELSYILQQNKSIVIDISKESECRIDETESPDVFEEEFYTAKPI